MTSIVGLLAACSAVSPDGAGPGSLGDESGGPASDTDDDADATGGSADETTDGETGAPKLDVDPDDADSGDEGGGMPTCKVVDDMDAVPPCEEKAPPDSFDPVLQWSWDGLDGEDSVAVTPVVANLTDDNEDGEIDLCDVPDVVVVAWTPGAQNQYPGRGHIYVLDGATGELHFRIDDTWIGEQAPALGDIDGDGLVEIVAFRNDDGGGTGRLVAFEHDGTPKWTSDSADGGIFFSSVALADLDADGDVEIITPSGVHDHEGKLLWGGNWMQSLGNAPTAADLDDDGDLEVISSASTTVFDDDGAIHHHGPYIPGFVGAAVADLDEDGLPEVVYGDAIVEHDGQLKLVMDPVPGVSWAKPVAIHDTDGDDLPEIVLPGSIYPGGKGIVSLVEPDGALVWQVEAEDAGNAGATAFDFLGDASAEAIYADEVNAFVYGPGGKVEMSVPRSSYTNIEYPIVADVDNDRSAEFVVVSNVMPGQQKTAPAVQAFGDAQDRWVGARRIWNQHTYHVTNVREDGTIPQVEPQHWKHLNTFRTQAQLEGGGVCKPEPEG